MKLHKPILVTAALWSTLLALALVRDKLHVLYRDSAIHSHFAMTLIALIIVSIVGWVYFLKHPYLL